MKSQAVLGGGSGAGFGGPVALTLCALVSVAIGCHTLYRLRTSVDVDERTPLILRFAVSLLMLAVLLVGAAVS